MQQTKLRHILSWGAIIPCYVALDNYLQIRTSLNFPPLQRCLPLHSLDTTVAKDDDTVPLQQDSNDKTPSSSSSSSLTKIAITIPTSLLSFASSPLHCNTTSPSVFMPSPSEHMTNIGGRAAAVAASNPGDVQHIRKLATRILGYPPSPKERFTDAELMRHAVHHGYLRATTREDQLASLEKAGRGVAATTRWLQHHAFSSPQELERTKDIVYWKGTDIEGHPILYISITTGLEACHGDKKQAVALANIVITRVQQALVELLSDKVGQPEQIRVVVDVHGAKTLEASKIAWVFKAVALELSRHYPGRLKEMALLDLPVMLSWLVGAVKKLVHPATRSKVKVINSSGYE